MTEPLADYRHTVRARHRAAAMDRIADRFAAGDLTDLPDVSSSLSNARSPAT